MGDQERRAKGRQRGASGTLFMGSYVTARATPDGVHRSAREITRDGLGGGRRRRARLSLLLRR